MAAANSIKQIVNFREDGQPEFNDENLRSIINAGASELPTAVIPIIGQARTGKSFLLNCSASYLSHMEEKKPGDWQRSKDVISGINWAQSEDAVTHGISMWHRPFIITHNGKEVAILLVDCQGTGDNEESVEGVDPTLMTICLRLGTVPLLNCRGDITKDDLQALKMFEHSNRKGSPAEKMFDNLTFVIRDWQNSDSYGKTERFQDIAKKSKLRDTIASVCRGFRDIASFQLPRPGMPIECASASTRPLKIEDIPSGFRGVMVELFEDVLSRCSKKAQGSICWRNGQDFMRHRYEPLVPAIKEIWKQGCFSEADGYMWLDAQTAYEEAMEVIRNHKISAVMTHTHIQVKESMEKVCDDARRQFKEIAGKNVNHVIYQGQLKKLADAGSRETKEILEHWHQLEEQRKDAQEKQEKAKKEAQEKLEKAEKEAQEKLEKEIREAQEKLEKEKKEAQEKLEKTKKEEQKKQEIANKEAQEKLEKAEKEAQEKLEKAEKEAQEKIQKARDEGYNEGQSATISTGLDWAMKGLQVASVIAGPGAAMYILREGGKEAIKKATKLAVRQVLAATPLGPYADILMLLDNIYIYTRSVEGIKVITLHQQPNIAPESLSQASEIINGFSPENRMKFLAFLKLKAVLDKL